MVPLVIAMFAAAMQRISLALRAKRHLGRLSPTWVASIATVYSLVILLGSYGLATLGSGARSKAADTHDTGTRAMACRSHRFARRYSSPIEWT